MAKVKAKLRDLSLKGEKVNTRWGDIQFDGDGLADIECDEEDLPMLRDTKPFPWLVEESVASVDAKGKPKDVDEDDDKKSTKKGDKK